MSMITASAWVPRGYAAQFPEKYHFDQDELDRISKLTRQHLEDAQADHKNAMDEDDNEDDDDEQVDDDDENESSQAKAQNGKIATDAEIDDDLKEYDLENYDNEPDDAHTDGAQFGNIKSMVYYDKDEDDPYITLPANGEPDEDDEEEREELQILASDNLVLTGRVEDDIAHLEVYVYEDEADNLYIHHDILLPAIPLAVEWIDMPVQKKDVGAEGRGNFVAIGTMDPDIEVWDLDIVDNMYPNAILGQASPESRPQKKKKKTRKPRDDYHVDSVLALAANRQHRNLLASASADQTVKLWDLNTTTCAKSYQYHSNKVCTLAWHPTESTAMLSGSYDRTVVAADMRAPDAGIRTWTVDSDLESVKWDPHNPQQFYAAVESGILYCFDARQTPSKGSGISQPVWRLQAHDDAVSAFDVNPIIRGYLATGSADKQVKLWSVNPEGPSMVVSRDLDVGRVFSANFAPDRDVGFRLAVAGSKGNLQIWDTASNAAIRRVFADRVPARTKNEESADAAADRLVGLELEDDSSDDNEDEGDDQGDLHEDE